MAIPRPEDYTDKDFDSLKRRARALLLSVFPEWSDETIADFGNILVELFCDIGDILAVNIDAAARESRITTARKRRSLLALCKLVGFTPRTAKAAQASVSLELDAPTAGDVLFLPGDALLTDEVAAPLRFLLLEPVVLVAGQVAVVATVENSEEATEQFESTTLANQSFVLQRPSYIDDTLVVSAANGAYEQRRNLLSSTSADRHFTVSVDQNDRATMRFGNGVNGAIPSGNIVATYRYGGGAAGNVAANSIKRTEKVYTDSLGNPVVVRVVQAARAVGGDDRQSNAEIRRLAPEQIRAPVNCVAREDYEINARRLTGIVSRALFLTSDQDAAIPENTGYLYVVPVGGGVLTAEQRATVLYQVTVVYPCPTTFTVLVADPSYVAVNISAQVYLKAGTTKATVRAAIVAKLTAFFSVKNADGTQNDKVNFGGAFGVGESAPSYSVAWSDIFAAILSATGVSKIDPGPGGLTLNDVRADLPLIGREFPQLGTVTLYDAATGAQF